MKSFEKNTKQFEKLKMIGALQGAFSFIIYIVLSYINIIMMFITMFITSETIISKAFECMFITQKL
ncbi:MAG: hypothetical protein DRP32_04985 [Thermotogae bacterium]|nr:MAG: hypothetical protein DRP32_04985 [Thermotogota bacterium]